MWPFLRPPPPPHSLYWSLLSSRDENDSHKEEGGGGLLLLAIQDGIMARDPANACSGPLPFQRATGELGEFQVRDFFRHSVFIYALIP